MKVTHRKIGLKGLLVQTVAGLGLIGWIGLERRRTYLGLAEFHLSEMAAFDAVRRSDGERADIYEGKSPRPAYFAYLMPVANTEQIRESESRNAQLAAYHGSLSRKYREAADHPWVAIEVDPASP